MTDTAAQAGELDVLCVGNSIVDVLAQTDDATLEKLDMVKGTMALIDADQAEALYAQMSAAIETSGGSAGNTAAGLASLNTKCAFIGRVRDDQLGDIFTHDIRSIGVEYATPAATDGPPTARCLILITPDAQRTMNTFLGASVNLGPEDIDEDLVARAKVTYLEGYLWDRDAAKAGLPARGRTCRGKGPARCRSACRTRSASTGTGSPSGSSSPGTSISCSPMRTRSPRCIRSRPSTMPCSMCALDCRIAALTRSEKGSVLVSGDEVHVVDAEPVDSVVDTTGAGDQFAAGFLSGFTQGKELATCARIGGIAASEVIAHVGPRPQVKLADLVASRL